MTEQRSSTLGVVPEVDGEVLSAEVDVGFGRGCLRGVLHRERSTVVNGRPIEHASHLEVVGCGEFSLHNVLVEGDAYLLAETENAVRRFGQTQRTRLRHVLDNDSLLTRTCYFLLSVPAH